MAGANHTLLLTNQGNLYATGANKCGQCLKLPCDVIPGFVRIDGRWRDCAATWEGSLAVREDGSILSFGRIKNHTDRIGIPKVGDKTINTNDVKSLTDTRLDGHNKGNVSIVGGVQHFIVFGEDGTYGYGDGKKGQFGVIPTSTRSPVKLRTSNVIQVACGKDFTCLYSRDDNITLYTTTSKHHPGQLSQSSIIPVT